MATVPDDPAISAAIALVAALRAELGAVQTGESDPMIGHDCWELPPPDETEHQRTARLRWWARAARRGDIEGARLVRRRWFARRSQVEAFIAEQGIRPAVRPAPRPAPTLALCPPSEASAQELAEEMLQNAGAPRRRRRA